MKHFKIIIIFSVTLFLSFSLKAQCLDFAKTKGFAKLDTTSYLPEGRLNAITLSEGDNLDVYKPFFRGRSYKIVVIGDINLPKLNFKVANFQRHILFDSKKQGNADSWEFTSDKNQNLIITVEVPKSNSYQPKTGCVAVIVGFAHK